MSAAHDDLIEQERRLLGELAELSMSMARRLHERAMAAEDAGEAEGLALAFQRSARSVRQTLALRAKLERDRARAAAETDQRAVAGRREAVVARKAHVQNVVSALIWTEAERGEIGELLVDLSRLVDAEAFHTDAFLDVPVETLIARLRRDLGLPANDAATQDPPERRSSG